MTLSITNDGKSVLTVRHSPGHAVLSAVVIAISLPGTILALLFSGPASLIVFPLILLAIGVNGLFTQRELSCVLNKATGVGMLKQSGLLGSQLAAEAMEFKTSDIVALEMKRHVARYADKFQIRLALCTGRRLNLSARNLSFSECQIFAEQIQRFLGPEIQSKAVN